MIVSLWMTRNPVTVGPETPIAEAAMVMAQRSIRRLPVVVPADGGLRLVGIVTTHDLARAFPPDLNPFVPDAWERGPRRPIAEVMSSALKTTAPDIPIEEAARILRDAKIGALPVIEGGNLVGIITESDIFRAFIEVVGIRSAGIRITFDLAKDEDPVATVADLGRRHGLRVASVLTLDHGGRRLGVARLQGLWTEKFVDAVWKSGHRVLNVIFPEGITRDGPPVK